MSYNGAMTTTTDDGMPGTELAVLADSQSQTHTRYAKATVRRRTRAAVRKAITDEVQQERYLAALPKLMVVSAALKAAGVGMGVLARWREQDGAFLVRETEARSAIADTLEAEAIRRAFKGVRKPVYQGGLLAGYVTEYSDQLLVLLLKAVRPERFRERSEVTLTPIVKTVAGFDVEEVL